MLNHATLEKMQAMKLSGMVEAFHQQLGSPEYAPLSFEERLGMLIDTEWTAREQRKLTRRLQMARLRYPASLEDVDFQTPRDLDRSLVLSLATCTWIAENQNLLVLGPTGTGKSFLACAFAEKACRSGYTAIYFRTPRLLQELAVARGDGSYSRLLARLVKVELLVLDDWLLTPLKDAERRDLLEVIEDRTERRSTLIAGQLPVASWHEAIGDPTLADAICDRLIHRAHKILLKAKGPSQRELRAKRERSAAVGRK
jgi:DNA replication protein DnaC